MKALYINRDCAKKRRNKKVAFIIALTRAAIFLCVFSPAWDAQGQINTENDSIRIETLPVDSSRLRIIENKAFGVGERLTFSLDYGFIHAGTAIMTVEKIDRLVGRDCFHITSWAFSSGTFSFFFKVRDKIDSYIDVQGIYSLRTEKHLQEGRYKAERVYNLYQLHGVSRNMARGDTLHIPPFAQDALSALYYVRTQELIIGTKVMVPQFDNGKIYNLAVDIQKKEKIKVPAGEFNTILVEPLLASEGIFQREGRMRIWLTDDERKIPVKMTSKIAIGSIGAHLERIQTDFGQE